MKTKDLLKVIIITSAAIVIPMLLLCFVLFGLGSGQETEDSQSETEEEVSGEMFLIMEHDTIEETLLLYSYETGLEYTYQYNFSTKFYNKYGKHYPAVRFTAGRAITLGSRDEFGYLTSVKLSDQVWEQEKVKRFSIDEENGVFTVGSTNYSIQGTVFVFSNDEKVDLSEITENDTLTVVGMGSRILSVNVTTGHGTLSLSNTKLFEGSLLKLNEDIFAEVTENMTMEIPEGKYTLTVANDGWGGSREITIERGETTEVDLDSMKGEGRKKGLISFDINVEGAKVYIDYKLVDHSKPVEVTYGTHTLEIKAEGCDNWRRYLVVNSPQATLVVELEEEDKKESEKDSEKDSEKESEKDSEKESESSSKDNTIKEPDRRPEIISVGQEQKVTKFVREFC